MGKNLIKILIGQRRVGKSYILQQIKTELVNQGICAPSNIILINKELSEFANVKDAKSLQQYLQTTWQNIKGKKALLIDEVQEIFGFEHVLRELIAKEDTDIYITGSNAHLLSSEIATLLTGRFLEIEIFPLSLNEFTKFHRLETNQDSLLKYIRYGGLPFLINLALTDEVAYPYLKSVYESILLKDIVERYQVRNVAFLKKLLEFIAEHIGSLISAKKISEFLKKEQIKISINPIINYLNYLNATYLALEIKRFEIGKKILEINSKHYFNDTGIRHAIRGYQTNDIGKILENLVFIHLKRHGYTTHVGTLNGKEIDFIGEKNGQKIYIQVAYLLTDEKTIEREFNNLIYIQDNYPKIVLSLDQLIGNNYKGIKHINIIEFLNSNNIDDIIRKS